MELYKKHRPTSMKGIIGNSGTVNALTNMLRRGTLPHTILFHGPSGCGKTTLARILMKQLQCHPMDFAEVNASSFRGIDSIRDVSRTMKLAPMGPCRVWLFDETHKWTNDAQNAALKMLEDTPDHVYFFLCTTDPQKLIKAIQTRCCQMPVRALTYNEMERLACRICKREEMVLTDDTLGDVIDASNGSARSMLVMLDKLANVSADVRPELAKDGMVDDAEGIDLCRALIARKPWKAVTSILRNLSADPEAVRWCVLGYARAVLMKKPDHQAYIVIRAFEEPFYESKAAGLLAACFEAIHGD